MKYYLLLKLLRLNYLCIIVDMYTLTNTQVPFILCVTNAYYNKIIT